MIKTLLLICLVLLGITAKLAFSKCSFEVSKQTYIDNGFICLLNFYKLSELQFNCSKPIKLNILGIYPRNSLILDNSLDVSSLELILKIKILVVLTNFKGFDCDLNFFKALGRIEFLVQSSTLEFFHGNMPANSNCNTSFFRPFEQSIYLNFHEKMEYLSNTCPLIFFNAKIEFLIINEISSTFIGKNILGFQNSDQKNLENLNSSIYQFIIKLYHTDVGEPLLNKYVFKDLIFLDIQGQITHIENEIFKNFKNLRVLRFRMQSIQHIFARQNKWLESINTDLDIDPEDQNRIIVYSERVFMLILNQLFYQTTLYNYPNEDLCYFKNFPHNKLVLVKLNPVFKTVCSCTEIFLIQYSYLFGDAINSNIKSIPDSYYLNQYYTQEFMKDSRQTYSHCVNRSIRQTINECNFKKRLSKCNLSSFQLTKNTQQVDFYMADWQFLSEKIHIIFSLYVNNIISAFSSIFCILILMILSGKTIEKELQMTYSFLRISSLFSILNMLINFLKPLANCLNEYFWCMSYLNKSSYAQYFNLIFIKFIGKSFRSASNFSHVMFSLSRYLKISKRESDFMKKISAKSYFLIIFIFSCLINLNTFFEYLIKKPEVEFSDESNGTWIKHQIPEIDSLSEDFTSAKYIALSFFNYLNIFFSDILYALSCFVIDLALLRFVKKKTKESEGIRTFVQNINTINSNKLKKNNKRESAKNRITWIIILNGINIILFRFSFDIVGLYGYFYWYDYATGNYKPNTGDYIICRYYNFCMSLEDICYCLYLISYIIQFLIFFRLDKNFKLGLKNFTVKIKKKLI